MIKYTENASLRPYNTFGVNAQAALLVEYSAEEDLPQIFADERVKGRPFWHVGQGSNLLFTQDYEGVILHGSIKGIRPTSQTEEVILLECGAGESWDHVCEWCVDRGFYGVENLSGIPGEVGAAAVQNIGAYGVEFKDVVVAVSVYDIVQGKNVIVSVADCHYGYRTSIFKTPEFKNRFIVTSVLLSLSRKAPFLLEYGNIKAALLERGFSLAQSSDKRKSNKSLRGKQITLHAMRDTICAIRSAKLPDPAVLGNAGSFFKNPVIPTVRYKALLSNHPDMPSYEVDASHVKVPAGWLIEHAGCSQRRVGDAEVYEKQCLVLVNRGHASARDIMQLAALVTDTVRERFDIQIEPEVNFI
ncbi:MAG: UDP-N-acetylmuramate dehydrogenase [Bacteroidales bacterium]|nr:UDP-N-acetylmuramate dehydrogenase [Bacteroidales bacterium]